MGTAWRAGGCLCGWRVGTESSMPTPFYCHMLSLLSTATWYRCYCHMLPLLRLHGVTAIATATWDCCYCHMGLLLLPHRHDYLHPENLKPPPVHTPLGPLPPRLPQELCKRPRLLRHFSRRWLQRPHLGEHEQHLL